MPAEISGLAYLDPASGEWVTAEEYLSGNVRDKLEAARAAASAAGDTDAQRWASNITALEGVQPADLGPDEIRAKLGAPWIPPGDVRAFAAETLGYAPAVSYLPVTAQWEVKAERGSADTAAATEEWGTGRIDGYRLLELAVNGRAPVIYDTVTHPGRGDPGPQPGRDDARRGEAAGAGGAVRRMGVGGPGTLPTGCAPSTTGGSTRWCCAATTARTSPSPAWPPGSRRTRTSGTWCTGSSPRRRACAPTRWGPARRRPCSWPPASSGNSAWRASR